MSPETEALIGTELPGGVVRRIDYSAWEVKYADGKPWCVREGQGRTYYREVEVLGPSSLIFEPGTMPRSGENTGRPGSVWIVTDAPLLVRG